VIDSQVLHVKGRLVADVEVKGGELTPRCAGRLLLFCHRDAESGYQSWTLLDIGHSVLGGDEADPGFVSVICTTARTLQEIREELDDDLRREQWRALVQAGSLNDPDLKTLWVPVQIDTDLQSASLLHRGLRVRQDGQRPENWQRAALAEAHHRLLWDLGFVVLESTTDVREVFPDGLPHWSDGCNSLVGAVRAAKYGYYVELVVAIDGAGEVYVRTADPGLSPGAPRRHAPRRLTECQEREVELVAQGVTGIVPQDDCWG
jgi:hypothetical protein